MKITFKLQGVERVIKQSGSNDFTAYKPGTETAIGYCSTLSSAVLKHIKEAAVLDDVGKEEVIELKDYIDRHKKLFEDVLGLSNEDISKFAVFEEKPVKEMSDEHKDKMRQGKKSKKEDPSPFSGL